MGTIRLSIILFLFSISAVAQQLVENKVANYSITAPSTWTVRHDGTITDIYAPDESSQDEWMEFLGISVSESNGASLENSFNYFMKEDFPGYYTNFKILNQGQESINGKKAFWALYSFSNSTEVNGATKAATLHNLFYLLLEGETLYFLNGIAEESIFTRYEESYKKMIRSFKLTK